MSLEGIVGRRLVTLDSTTYVIGLLDRAQTALPQSDNNTMEELKMKLKSFHAAMLSDLSSSISERCISTAKQFLVRSHIYLSKTTPPQLSSATDAIIITNDLLNTQQYINLLFHSLSTKQSNDSTTESIGRNLLTTISKHFTKAIISAPTITKTGFSQFEADASLILKSFPHNILSDASNDTSSDLSLLKECLSIFNLTVHEKEMLRDAVVGITGGEEGEIGDVAQREIWEILSTKGFKIINHEYFLNLLEKSLKIVGTDSE